MKLNRGRGFLLSAAGTALVTLAACGAGGGSGTVTIASGDSLVNVSSKAIAPGARCTFGGVELYSGIDANQNGLLAPPRCPKPWWSATGKTA